MTIPADEIDGGAPDTDGALCATANWLMKNLD